MYRERLHRGARWLARSGKRLAVTIAGFLVLVVGLAMIPLPGPAILVIPAGLAILATQFSWARRVLVAVRRRAGDAAGRFRARHPRPSEPTIPEEAPSEESGALDGRGEVA